MRMRGQEVARARRAGGMVALAVGMGMLTGVGAPLAGQSADPIEIPLRLEDGRMIVTAEGSDGRTYDFVLGLGTTVLTESGATRVRAAGSELMLGGVDVRTEGPFEVPDRYLAGSEAVGVLGGATLNRYDIVIDVPNGRLLMKPSGRSVRWPGIALSGSVPLQVYHDVLLRADVEFGGKLVGGLIDLSKPNLEVSEALGDRIRDGSVGSFRMGYGNWSELAARVVDDPSFARWDPAGDGFAILGASVAYDCAIAISWYHRELRTCTR